VFPAGEFWLDAQSVETEVPSAIADEDLIDVFSSDFSVIGDMRRNFLVKAVDEKLSWSSWIHRLLVWF